MLRGYSPARTFSALAFQVTLFQHTGVSPIFLVLTREIHIFEKYVRIKIEGGKILVLTIILSSKLNEVNASYPCKYNSIF